MHNSNSNTNRAADFFTRIKGGGVTPGPSINPFLIYQSNQRQQHNNTTSSSSSETMASNVNIAPTFDASKLVIMQNVYSHLVKI